MIPKRSDGLEDLDFERNLSMLTTTYKIIAKILADHFKPIVPNVVDVQQMGFVHDHCSTNKLLTLKLVGL